MSMKKWVVLPLNKERAARLAEQWDIPFFLAMMLDIRGITGREEVESYLTNEGDLFQPAQLKDMEKAVARVQKAVDTFEKICVYGDYDADGVTATTLLYSYLDSRVANVMYYIPEREGEGYGMNKAAVDRLHEQNVSLIVTVDNGIASVEEVAYANSLGMEVVITDHHQPQGALPQAVAVVDPHRRDCTSVFKDLAGVGVAYKLIAAMEEQDGDAESLLDNYADLIAVGTIGDVVPLTGENRLLVKKGLQQIKNTDRIGLKSLLAEMGMEGKALTAGNVSFTIVPRINAAGRLGSSDKVVRLLLSEYPEEAEALSADICEENKERQQIEADIIRQIEEWFAKNPSLKYDRVIVVAGENWHSGVIGIVASRITEKYGRPCIVIAVDGEEAKGSGRSIAGFSLYDAVYACRQYLTRFGGHPMAAGLSMHARDVDAFRVAINEYAGHFQGGMPFPQLHIDCKLNPAALSTELVAQMSPLEPFGSGNPTPVFGLYAMTLTDICPVGGGKHLRLTFCRKDTFITAMCFSTRQEQFAYSKGDVLDLAVTIEKSEFRGEQSVSVYIKDIKLHEVCEEELIRQKYLYEAIKRDETLQISYLEPFIPSRSDFAAVYRYLRAQGGWNFGLDVLHYRLQKESSANGGITYGRLAILLDIMQELQLIDLAADGDTYHISLHEMDRKVDLQSSKILAALHLMGQEG